MSMQVAGAAGAMAAAVAASNYLVLFPFNDWFTAGTLSYPATFLLTDLTNRQLGKAAADKVVLAGFLVAMPISWYLSGPRIAIASGTAYLSSQLLDVRIFDSKRFIMFCLHFFLLCFEIRFQSFNLGTFCSDRVVVVL